jgi:hypothetical protein
VLFAHLAEEIMDNMWHARSLARGGVPQAAAGLLACGPGPHYYGRRCLFEPPGCNPNVQAQLPDVNVF